MVPADRRMLNVAYTMCRKMYAFLCLATMMVVTMMVATMTMTMTTMAATTMTATTPIIGERDQASICSNTIFELIYSLYTAVKHCQSYMLHRYCTIMLCESSLAFESNTGITIIYTVVISGIVSCFEQFFILYACSCTINFAQPHHVAPEFTSQSDTIPRSSPLSHVNKATISQLIKISHHPESSRGISSVGRNMAALAL